MIDLTSNVRSHVLILRDGRKFSITKQQYTGIRMDKEDKKRTAMFQLTDADTKEIVFDGEYGDIREFQQKQTDSTYANAVWICSFGERHPLSMQGECDCSRKYDCIGIIFMDKIRALGYKVDYARDITEEMRQDFINNKK